MGSAGLVQICTILMQQYTKRVRIFGAALSRFPGFVPPRLIL